MLCVQVLNYIQSSDTMYSIKLDGSAGQQRFPGPVKAPGSEMNRTETGATWRLHLISKAISAQLQLFVAVLECGPNGLISLTLSSESRTLNFQVRFHKSPNYRLIKFIKQAFEMSKASLGAILQPLTKSPWGSDRGPNQAFMEEAKQETGY